MRKSILFLTIILAFSACTKKDKQYVIGISQCSEDSWREKMNNEIKREAYLYDNIQLDIESAKDDSKLQVKQIEKMIKDNVDLIIVSPNDEQDIVPAINKAYNNGIPIVLVDRKVKTKKYTAYIGADNKEIGRDVGNYIGHILKGKGTVIEIQGLKGSSPTYERHVGFKETIANYPGIKIINGGYGDWFEQKALLLMDSTLVKGIKPDAVFAHCDRMAIGAHKAALHNNVKDVKYIGIDALNTNDGGIYAVSTGALDASFMYPTRGDLVLELAINILQKKKYKKENLLYSGIVDATNANTLLNQASELKTLDNQLEIIHKRTSNFASQYRNLTIFICLTTILAFLLLLSVMAIYKAYSQKKKLTKRLQHMLSLSMRTNMSKLTTPNERTSISKKNNEHDSEEKIVNPEEGKQFFTQFRNMINENMSDPDFNVDEMSKNMGMSRVQLYRNVKALTSHSPIEILRIIRLKRADSLLQDGNMNVSEVSYEVGFSSPSYFTKCYKEYFGKLPKDNK